MEATDRPTTSVRFAISLGIWAAFLGVVVICTLMRDGHLGLGFKFESLAAAAPPAVAAALSISLAWHFRDRIGLCWLGFGLSAILWALTVLAQSFPGATPPPGSFRGPEILVISSAVAQVSALFAFFVRNVDAYTLIRRLCLLGILLICLYAIVAFPLHTQLGNPQLTPLRRVTIIVLLTLEPAGALFLLTNLLAYRKFGSRAARLLISGSAIGRGIASLGDGVALLRGTVGLENWQLVTWIVGFGLLGSAALYVRMSGRALDLRQQDGANEAETAAGRLIEVGTPVIGILGVISARLLTVDPIDTYEAALIIVPTLLGIVLLFSVGEWFSRSNEARLRRSAEAIRDLLGAVLDIIPDAVFGIDQRGTIRLANRSAGALFGYADGELQGKPMDILIPEDRRKDHTASFAEFDEQGIGLRMGTERRPIRVQRRDGRQFPAEASLRRLALQAETWFIVSLRDVSAQLERARQLESAREASELASRAKSEFLANMSHELRTPLNAILGFSELIESQRLGQNLPRDRDYAHQIHTAGVHLLEIINDILDLSKVEAGRIQLREEPLDLKRIVDGCLFLLKERADRGCVSVTSHVPADLPLLLADEIRVKQILINLLSNAVKFTPAGGHTVVDAELLADGRLALRVTDTGIGMKKGDIPKAMSVFGQVDSSLARQREGTGLGLPLTLKLAELHGAQFDIESAPGAGTRVTIIFPSMRTCGRDQPRVATAT